MTSALHAEGPRFDPGLVYFLFRLASLNLASCVRTFVCFRGVCHEFPKIARIESGNFILEVLILTAPRARAECRHKNLWHSARARAGGVRAGDERRQTGASIAQMVERKTLNLVVVGSIPTGGAFVPLAPVA